MTAQRLALPPQYRPGPRYKRQCYYNAFEHASLNGDAWSVVHGVVRPDFAEAPGPMGHAWAQIEHEDETWAWDPCLNLWARAADFGRLLRVSEALAYSLAEAKALARQHEHVGPWEDCISAGFARRVGRRIVIDTPAHAKSIAQPMTPPREGRM